MNSVVIKNATIINEHARFEGDVRFRHQRIEKIASQIQPLENERVIDAEGKWLLPGMIDDQVHFREPGLTHKGSIATESRAAVMGGITSFMEMPNVNPSTTTLAAIEYKEAIARHDSFANYAFYLGATEDNLEVIKSLDPNRVCGVKVFMGASTGSLLVENPTILEAIFRESPVLIATHCESGPVIQRNLDRLLQKTQPPSIHHHPIIRDDEACYASSSYAVALAKKHQTQLNVLHITTAKELSLFSHAPLSEKKITAEACVHHLWFSDQDYARLGNLIKCNPAIKKTSDRDALLAALRSGVIDIVATDHAPHTLSEKQQAYPEAPAGLPLVQHALLMMLEHVVQGRLSLEDVVEKCAHNPAIRYGVADRGFIREGYFADCVLIDPDAMTQVTSESIAYQCGWSPLLGHTFSTRIASTFVNGQCVFDGHSVPIHTSAAQPLFFTREQ
jgi:dihydroorotase